MAGWRRLDCRSANACSSSLNIRFRRPAATHTYACTARPRTARTVRAWVVACAIASALTVGPVFAKSSGERGAPATASKLVNDALVYSGFSGECSQTAFVVNATGNLAVVGGPVTGQGATTLDGAPYDTYDLDLGAGPATFATKFDRVFQAPLPSANYEMVFTTRVMLGGIEQGQSITTIVCTNGIVSARNRAIPSAPEQVPVGGWPVWLALTLLLASSVAIRIPVGRR